MTERMVTVTMQTAEYLLKLHKANQKGNGITPNMWKFVQEDLWNGIQVAKGLDESFYPRKATRYPQRKKKVIDIDPPF